MNAGPHEDSAPDQQVADVLGDETSEAVAQLVSLLAPRLRYDSDEAFRATSARAATDPAPPKVQPSYINVLRVPPEGRIEASSDPQIVGSAQLSLEYLGGRVGGTPTRDEWIDISYSPDGSQRSVDDHLAAAAEIAEHFSSAVYGRAVRDEDDGKLWLQYWLYYYYDDKSVFGQSVGAHEGDWEWVQYRTSDTAQALLDRGLSLPEFVSQLRAESVDLIDELSYSGHDEAVRARWDQADRVPVAGELSLSAPVVYVARGSHANYFGRRGRILDRTDGAVGPDQTDCRNPVTRSALAPLGGSLG